MSQKNPKVTVIILNCNGKKFLKQNLTSVLKQTYESFEILIVDNGSDDGSIEYIKKLKKTEKKITLLETGKNLGYVGGNNKGIKKVLKEAKSNYVVLLNNDVKVAQDWLVNLIAGFSENDIGICTSKIFLYYPYQQIVLVPNGDVTLKSLRFGNCEYHLLEFANGFDSKGKLFSFPKKLKSGEVYNFGVPYVSGIQTKERLELRFKGKSMKIFSGEEKRELVKSGSISFSLAGKHIIQNAGSSFLKKNIVFEDRKLFEFDKETPTQIVDAGCGCAMAIRVELLEKLGIFEEKYFAYFEDTELSYRYSQAGFKTKFVSDALCFHWAWGTSGFELTGNQIFWTTRNRLWFIRKYFGLMKFLYYYLRTFARMLVWGLKFPFDKKASVFLASYLKVLLEVLRG